jgi:hypothetical protein
MVREKAWSYTSMMQRHLVGRKIPKLRKKYIVSVSGIDTTSSLKMGEVGYIFPKLDSYEQKYTASYTIRQ